MYEHALFTKVNDQADTGVKNSIIFYYIHAKVLSEHYFECKNPKVDKTVQFSAKPSNKWNACVLLTLVWLIISQYSGQQYYRPPMHTFD